MKDSPILVSIERDTGHFEFTQAQIEQFIRKYALSANFTLYCFNAYSAYVAYMRREGREQEAEQNMNKNHEWTRKAHEHMLADFFAKMVAQRTIKIPRLNCMLEYEHTFSDN